MSETPKTALISVYNKEGIVEFAQELLSLGFQIISSGGTAKTLSEAGVAVSDVAELVGGKAILGHRVVTLSREVHAGLLARDTVEDRDEIEKLGIPFIDLVCVDLYPLKEEIANPDATIESVIEKTDIGGPTMIRSATKGRRIVICDPEDRASVIEWFKTDMPNRDEFVTKLASKAEMVVADYCLASAIYHGKGEYDGQIGTPIKELKYGENAWQSPAILYGDNAIKKDPLSISEFQIIAGTEPSYNNICDLDRLLQTITHIAAALDFYKNDCKIAVGVKHGNACGVGVGHTQKSAIRKMLRGDLRAIFGGVVMTNFEIDDDLAETLVNYKMGEGKKRLLDTVIAPNFTSGAIETLERKRGKCRIIANQALGNLSVESLDFAPKRRAVRSGWVLQPNHTYVLDFNDPEMEKHGSLFAEEKGDMLIAWAVGSTSNSNTVTLVKLGQLLGNGVGQQDRVGACELAIKRALDAGHDIKGAVAYSDSFFPFVDGPEVLAKAGISSIIASSSSVNDEEVKKFCSENDVSLYLVPDKKARGFFGH